MSPDSRSGSEKPLNFWVWLEISRGQDQGPVPVPVPVREISSSPRQSPEHSNQQCIVPREREQRRILGMIAAEQSYSLQMGDHDSSERVHMLPLVCLRTTTTTQQPNHHHHQDDGERWICRLRNELIMPSLISLHCINQIRALHLAIDRLGRIRSSFRQVVITAADPTNAAPNHLEDRLLLIHPVFSFSKVAHLMIDYLCQKGTKKKQQQLVSLS